MLKKAKKDNDDTSTLKRKSHPNESTAVPDFYDNILKLEFDIVSSNSRDENEWYGPWTSLLSRLFPPHAGFQIAPQHMLAEYRGTPEWTIYFLVKIPISMSLVVCVVAVKPFYNYDSSALRVKAYNQLKERLQDHMFPHVRDNIKTLHGLSCLGPHFMVMKMDTTHERALPALRLENMEEDPENVAPTNWWEHKAMGLQGRMRLLKLVEDIKASLKGNLEYMLQPAVLRFLEVLLEDESDQKESGDESKKRKRRN